MNIACRCDLSFFSVRVYEYEYSYPQTSYFTFCQIFISNSRISPSTRVLLIVAGSV